MEKRRKNSEKILKISRSNLEKTFSAPILPSLPEFAKKARKNKDEPVILGEILTKTHTENPPKSSRLPPKTQITPRERRSKSARENLTKSRENRSKSGRENLTHSSETYLILIEEPCLTSRTSPSKKSKRKKKLESGKSLDSLQKILHSPRSSSVSSHKVPSPDEQ